MDRGVGTRRYFDLHYSSRDWRFYKNILSEIIKFSEPGSILDVGAGCGYFVEAAIRWNLDCKGLEGSMEAIKIALKRYPAMDIRQHFLSNPFPFMDNLFGTVVMNQVIEHLEPDVAENAVQEAYRILCPSGMLFIRSPSRFNNYEKKADPTHINMVSPKELEKLLFSKGFRNIIPDNLPLSILGDNKLGKKLMSFLFQLSHWDRLSATANCIAYKTTGSENLRN